MTDPWAQAANDSLHMLPVLPFGTPVELGYVFRYDNSSLEPVGRFTDVTGQTVDLTDVIESIGSRDEEVLSGSDVGVRVLASGQASQLFPHTPHAAARIDVQLSRSKSAFALVTGLTQRSLTSPIELVRAALAASALGSWERDYVFVYSIGTTTSMRVAIAQENDTRVQFAADADVDVAQPLAKIGGSFAFTLSSHQLLHHESTGAVEFFRAYRLKGANPDDVHSLDIDLSLFVEDYQP